MTNPSIRQLALRRAADAVTASLNQDMPAELADASPGVRWEYETELKKIAATLYRRASEAGP